MEFEADRLSLNINSSCSIFSRSKQQWLDGSVSKILIDSITNQEWLVVKYGNNQSKKIQRFCRDLRSIQLKKERIFGWEELQSPPFDIHIGNQYSNIVSINAMEFAIATEMISSELGTYGSFVGGIYVYSVIVNDWMLLREYPTKIPFLKSTKLSLTFNSITNELYIYGVHENALYSIIAKLNIYTRKFKHKIIKSYNAGIGSTALIIDEKLHLIGGAVSNKHAIYNEEKHDFDKTYDIWDNTKGNIEHGVIYNTCTSMLWVLGGGNGIGKNISNIDEIWAHDLSGTYYHLTPDAAWNKLNIKMPYEMRLSCCVCYNRFIVIFCGTTPSIFIMNINKMGYDSYKNTNGKYNVIEGKSSLSLPCKNNLQNKYYGIILPICPDYDSDLMVVGYVKQYISKKYDNYISDLITLHISDLIYAFFQTEYIYLIQQETIKPKIWRICVDDILNSIIPI